MRAEEQGMRGGSRFTFPHGRAAILGLGLWAAGLGALTGIPRDAAAQAALTCGTTVTGEVTAVGSAGSSEIEFSYSGSAGRVITLDARTVTAVDPGFTPCWQLIAPSGAPAGARICGGDQKRTLAESGTYLVRVRDQNRDERGIFSLTLQVVDGSGSCGAPLVCDAEGASGMIDQPGGSVALRFTGHAGDRISLSLAETSTSDPGFVACGELYSPIGGLVGTRDCGRSEPLLPETGTYTLVVSAQDHRASGSFHASLQGLSAGSVCGPPLACGDAAVGALPAPGDTDTFRFPAAVDDAFALHLGTSARTDPTFNACLDVWSPTGKHPVGPSCGPVTLRAAEAGDYTVQVFAQNRGDRGDYRLSFQVATEAKHCAASLACGIGERGQIEVVGDSDAFAFEAQAGVVAIQARAATIGTNDIVPKWWLFSPVGVRLQVGRPGLAVVGLPVAGTYTLVIADDNDDQTGEYAVEVEGISSETQCGPAIGCGGAATLGRLDTRADIDAFAFVVAANDQVSIDVARAGVNDPSDFNPCWAVYDSAGAPVLTNQCAIRQVTFAAAGRYTILVNEDGGDAVGDYRVTLTGTCPPAPDADGDGVPDAVDNCPTRANPGQEDTGGVGVGSLPDGLGDVCQCGDVTGDGQVSIVDATAIARSVLVPPTATLARPERCDVGGSTGCSLTDSVIVRRALLQPPTATIQQVCTPAVP